MLNQKGLLLIVLTLNFLFTCNQPNIPKISNDEYVLYNAIIEYYCQESLHQYAVIYDSTCIDPIIKDFRNEPDKMDSLCILALFKNWDDTLNYCIAKDYYFKNKVSCEIDRKLFKSPRLDKLISVTQLNSVFSTGDIDDSWNQFYNVFPNSIGYIKLSRVGFDKSMTRAILYAENYCGALCGAGDYFYLEKRNGTWELIERKGAWES